MTAFTQMLAASWQANDSLLCVGLDPDPARFPRHLQTHPDGLLRFCLDIVDATADLVCAFKPQIAYFSACRAEAALEKLIEHIHRRHPGIPVILDAKRGDIGATAAQYAREAFERYRADAVTLNPYMGFDSIEPYFDYPDKGIVLLCRTSNPGGSDLQFLPIQNSAAHGEHAVPGDLPGERLYERVARLAAGPWNVTGQCALVVGATFPQEIARVRALTGEMPLLVPGVGTQGGDVEAVVKAGRTPDGSGLIINASRAILYASPDADFADAARQAALAFRNQMTGIRNPR